mgnify:CR=1 FL=1
MRCDADTINKCIKNSILYLNGTIEPRYLTINERVRQFGGHPSYARFLMFMGLGLLTRQKKTLYFKCRNKEDLINIPKSLGGVDLVKKFDSKIILKSFFIYL